MNTDARLTAKLLSACPPDSAQKEKLEDVLSKKYGKAVELVWEEDRAAQGGGHRHGRRLPHQLHRLHHS